MCGLEPGTGRLACLDTGDPRAVSHRAHKWDGALGSELHPSGKHAWSGCLSLLPKAWGPLGCRAWSPAAQAPRDSPRTPSPGRLPCLPCHSSGYIPRIQPCPLFPRMLAAVAAAVNPSERAPGDPPRRERETGRPGSSRSRWTLYAATRWWQSDPRGKSQLPIPMCLSHEQFVPSLSLDGLIPAGQ